MGNENKGIGNLQTMGEDVTGEIFEDQPRTSFETLAGEPIDLENYTETQLNEVNRQIDEWVQYGGADLTFYVKDDGMDYILKHMTPSENDPEIPTGHLTRVELSRFFDREKYQVGDTLKDNIPVRSYSRTPEATRQFLEKNYNDEDKYMVLYRTNGNVPNFNATKWSSKYDWEKESFVQQNKLKITKITELDDKNRKELLSKELGVDFPQSQEIPHMVVVDVEFSG